jgi:hypothetical protein
MNRKYISMIGLAAALSGALSQASHSQTVENSTSSGSSSGSSGGSDITYTLSGLIRSETALATNGGQNPLNQTGNLFNGVPTMRVSPIATDTTTRDGQNYNQTLDMQQFRFQLDGSVKFSPQFTFIAKLRGIYDPNWYQDFNPALSNSHAMGELYGRPNFFSYDVQGLSHPNPLEWAGQNYMIDFPAFFLEYNNGPLNLRLGNQQIAWGQAIFFRVLDVPDGLDYRRHSVLDYVPEEFSDKRVPALSLRASLQMGQNWLLDSFVEKFQPSVYPNPNTPYNVIASQFTIVDDYKQYDNRLNFGLRIKGEVDGIGLQGVLARRYNPDGVYRWTASGVNRDIPGLPGSGTVLQHTPFEVDSSGVWSSNEWYNYAGQARLNGTTGLNSAINNFQPWAGLLGAAAVPNYAYASQELNEFFQLAGGLLTGTNNAGLRGWLARDYREETNIGGGVSKVFEGAPGSWNDQLIANVEVLYTPDRIFTNPSLDVGFLRKNETIAALVLEKYQRFSSSLPATYLVGQFLYRSQSDLFGRYLGGYGGSQTEEAPGKTGGYKAMALAIQQPFANLIWRADLAVLYDTGGGILVQPALRWKPNGTYTVEAFYNYVNGKLNGNPTDNALSTANYVKEFTLRLGAQF